MTGILYEDRKRFWYLHKELMLKSFYQKVTNANEFDVFQSVFKQKYYNFVKPHINGSKLKWDKVQHVIRNLETRGYGASFYIYEKLQKTYQEKLQSDGYHITRDDIWVIKYILDKHELDESVFEDVNEDNFDIFQNLVQECFPDYDSNAEYTSHCLRLTKQDPNNFVNVMVKIDGAYVAFGSVAMDPKLDIGFIHNIGTMPSDRRNGYFTLLTKYLENLALMNNVHNTYANVEEDGGSFHGFLKIGYQIIDGKYIIYSK